MDSAKVVELYKKGHSIDYIINLFYYQKKQENKVINAQTRKIILITNNLTKGEIRGQVYKILCENLKKQNDKK